MDISHLEMLIETGQRQEIADLLSKKPGLASQNTSLQVTPVMLACFYNKKDIAKIIAEYYPDLSLFEACAIGNTELAQSKLNSNPDSINEYSVNGFTPLGLACYFGHEDIVKFLISKAAEVNKPANNGFNVFPLHSAVAVRSYPIVKLLLDAGAQANIKQQAGLTPLHTAAQNGDIEIIILLLEHQAEPDTRMEGGKLPADLAAEKGFAEIAEILKP